MHFEMNDRGEYFNKSCVVPYPIFQSPMTAECRFILVCMLYSSILIAHVIDFVLIINIQVFDPNTIVPLIPDIRSLICEPPRGKTNNVVSEQVRHKPSCTSTEDG